jgi:hypothetical protein
MRPDRMMWKPLAFAGLLAAAWAMAGPAAALDKCSVGQRVVKPGGELATVTATSGSGCTVRADGEPFTDTYAAFMLDPAPGGGGGGTAPAARSRDSAPTPTAPTGGGPVPGLYQCTGGPAGNLKLRFLGGGRYANEQGKVGVYSYNAGNGRMAFTSGPWSGFFGKVLAGGRIGLTSKPDASFYQMTCDRRG